MMVWHWWEKHRVTHASLPFDSWKTTPYIAARAANEKAVNLGREGLYLFLISLLNKCP